jgi:protein-S-isoprenylcysteine O-methyltransferase Ste14
MVGESFFSSWRRRTPVAQANLPWYSYAYYYLAGFLGSSLSVALIYDSVYSLVGVCMSAGYIVGHVMPVEEEWMKKTFGREWTDYCAKVKRFIVI